MSEIRAWACGWEMDGSDLSSVAVIQARTGLDAWCSVVKSYGGQGTSLRKLWEPYRVYSGVDYGDARVDAAIEDLEITLGRLLD
jgi:hypothetical protein